MSLSNHVLSRAAAAGLLGLALAAPLRPAQAGRRPGAGAESGSR